MRSDDPVAPRRPRVAVVGAGISGLTAAWRLVTGSAPCDVVVLEARDSAGGILRLGDVGGVTVDLGAESVLARRPEAVDLIREVGLGDDLVHPATAAALVLARGSLRPLPSPTVMGVPGDPRIVADVLTGDEVARVAAEPGLPGEPVTDDVDVASYVGGRVGPAVVDRLVEPLLGGVYAGRAERLSLQATLPQVWAYARRGGSLLSAVAAATSPSPGAAPSPVFAGIRGGIGRLPQTLVERLAAGGAEFRWGTTVRGLRRAPGGWRLQVASRDGAGVAGSVLDVDAVVIAVPPPAAARLLADEVPHAAAELARIETASVALVSALVPAAVLDGLTGRSGLLVPPVEGYAIKAATFSSRKWAWVDGLAGDLAAIRVSLGRAGETAVLQRDDDDLAALGLADLGRVLGRPVAPVAVRVTRWGGALPQYAVGHVDLVARVRDAVAAAGGLAICGAALDGVGVPACIAAATRAVEALTVGATMSA